MVKKEYVFKDVYDVILGSACRKWYAVAYYPKLQRIERVGVSLTEQSDILIDHLPRTGYSCATYPPHEYGKELLILKDDIYPFWEAMFLDKEKYYKVLFLGTGEVHETKVRIVPSGVGAKFELEYKETGKKVYYSREGYDSEFVVIKNTEKK